MMEWGASAVMAKRSRWFRIALVAANFAAAAVLLLQAGCASSGGREADPEFAATQGGEAELELAEFHFSPGDEIGISVHQHPELDRKLRIPQNGVISYPVIGEIAVSRMTVRELQMVIADGLAAERVQRIGAGDEISVRVIRHTELGTVTVVPASGEVDIPLAGPVMVSGKTTEEASSAIADALSGVLVEPNVITSISRSSTPTRIENAQIAVEVLRFGGQKLLVLGQVNRPGVYLDEGQTSLLGAIALAGGVTDDAKLVNVAVVRPGREGQEQRSMMFDVNSAMKGDHSQNPVLQRGDVIYVPRTRIATTAIFFRNLYAIVRPIVEIETGIWLGQNIAEGPRRSSNTVVFRN
jgi:polysaccharide export outer membrane protein